MDLFCFASRNERNIHLGIEHQLWAVASLSNVQSMAARVTKAGKYMQVGAYGLLYCNPRHAFTVPFIVRSKPDPDAVVNDVWPEPWRLPFKIETLGTLSRQMPADEAKRRWPFLQKRLGPSGGVSAAMNLTGTTVFVPVEITPDDWALICDDLANPR